MLLTKILVMSKKNIMLLTKILAMTKKTIIVLTKILVDKEDHYATY